TCALPISAPEEDDADQEERGEADDENPLEIAEAAGHDFGGGRRTAGVASLPRAGLSGGRRWGGGGGDVERGASGDGIARVDAHASLRAGGSEACSGDLYGGRSDEKDAGGHDSRGQAEAGGVAGVRNLIGEADAAFAGAEGERDGVMLRAAVNGALHGGHAGRA